MNTVSACNQMAKSDPPLVCYLTSSHHVLDKDSYEVPALINMLCASDSLPSCTSCFFTKTLNPTLFILAGFLLTAKSYRHIRSLVSQIEAPNSIVKMWLFT